MKARPAQVAADNVRRWKALHGDALLKHDPIIDRSPAQKQMRVNQMSAELELLGYSIVPTEWLRAKVWAA